MRENQEEYVSVADETGKTIGAYKRHTQWPTGCFSQIAATLVMNSKGNLILQQRAARKSKYPLKWSYSSGGHVNAGETYEQAALRELEEEMGIQGKIDSYIGEARSVINGKPGAFHKAYLVKHDGPYIFDPHEAAQIKEFTIEELKKLIQKNSDDFNPPFIDIFHQFIYPYGRSVSPLIQQFSDLFNNKKTVLDIGCAHGANSFHFAQKGLSVTAVDKALPENITSHPFIQFKNEDIRFFDFKSYDIILALNVLQFLTKDTQQVILTKMIQALNPKGLLLIASFTTHDPSYQTTPCIPGHFNPNELHEWALQNNLDLFYYKEEIIKDNHPPIGSHQHGIVRLFAQKK